MTHNTNCNCRQQTRWIRTFTSGYAYRDFDGNLVQPKDLPAFGDFQGTIPFDRITGIYPNRQDDRYLNVRIRGERNECNAFTMILKSDLHVIAPELAETFPLPQGGQR